MKRIFFTIGVLLPVLMILSITASAIDTPWLPLTPDSTTTTEEELKSDGETTDSSIGSTDDSINSEVNILEEKNNTATQPSDSENTSDEENGKSGCGSVIGIYTVLIALVSVATVCTQKARKVSL